jgi:alkylhydroperoxidase/carboxymuconolactone decarboxylase family protein YurZ
VEHDWPKTFPCSGLRELLWCARLYAPGTRRHIQAALKAGATMEEIMEVLKLCIVQGVQACNLGVPMLVEELAQDEGQDTTP